MTFRRLIPSHGLGFRKPHPVQHVLDDFRPRWQPRHFMDTGHQLLGALLFVGQARIFNRTRRKPVAESVNQNDFTRTVRRQLQRGNRIGQMIQNAGKPGDVELFLQTADVQQIGGAKLDARTVGVTMFGDEFGLINPMVTHVKPQNPRRAMIFGKKAVTAAIAGAVQERFAVQAVGEHLTDLLLE